MKAAASTTRKLFAFSTGIKQIHHIPRNGRLRILHTKISFLALAEALRLPAGYFVAHRLQHFVAVIPVPLGG